MSKIFLVVLSALLIAAPIELSARQAVKHHAAKAQTRTATPRAANPNCAIGATPPAGTQCGISDLSLRPGGALQDTDTMRLCPDAAGCFGGEATYQDAQAPLGTLWKPYIRNQFTGTNPIVVNPATGAISCPTCGTSTGGITGIMVAPGLTVQPGTYNTGTGTPATVVNGSVISPQLMWEGHSSAYTVAATDNAKLLEATALGPVVFTIPAPGVPGSSSFSFSYGGYPYTVTATSGTIYGCGVSNGSSITVAFDTILIPGSISGSAAWKCSGSGNSTIVPLSWGPGMNLSTSPQPALTKRGIPVQVTGYACMAGALVTGTPAYIDLAYCPDGTVPAAPNFTGCTLINNAASNAGSCKAGTAATVAQTQTLTPAASVVIPNGNTLWLVGSGSGWGTGSANVASSSGVIELVTSP